MIPSAEPERPTDTRSLPAVSSLLDLAVCGLLLLCRLSVIWHAARVTRHGRFDSKGGTMTLRPAAATA
nr:MAG TPA: hypothetical protein [Caudoviricetes sp.]